MPDEPVKQSLEVGESAADPFRYIRHDGQIYLRQEDVVDAIRRAAIDVLDPVSRSKVGDLADRIEGIR